MARRPHQAKTLEFGDHWAEGAWVLVRPDRYVGAIGARDEIGALENYLREVSLDASACDRA